MAKYHLVAINERTKRRELLTSTPCTHDEGCTMLRKFTPHRDVRIQLEPAPDYTFTPAPGLPAAKRGQLSLALASVATPSKRPKRRRSPEAARMEIAARGARVLAQEVPRGRDACCGATLIYLSEGGEILRADFHNLTRAQKNEIEAVSLDERRHKPVRTVVFPSEAVCSEIVEIQHREAA
jgi:hypothetical protein